MILSSSSMPKVKLTGKKLDQKLYRWHTGYPGGLRSRTAAEMLARKPEEVIRRLSGV